MGNRPKQIAIIGGRSATEKQLMLAEKMGRLIAEKGYQLVCGGLIGVMEAACKGAFEAGGETIGVLPGINREEANRYVSIPIATGIGIARNSIIAHSADSAIAISGRYGTLSEIAYCLQLGKPVVLLGCSWEIEGAAKVSTPEEAIMRIESEL